jgi:spore maturation protein CgeB
VRVLVVDTYYPAFLKAHYAASPGLERQPYEEQWDALMARRFGTSDAYSYHLRKLGHDAVEIVANCEALQLAWAREHGAEGRLTSRVSRVLPGPARAFARRSNLTSVAVAQIDAFRPDVVYLQDLWFFGARTLASLRREGRLVVGQLASELPPLRRLRLLDLITTALPQYVERFRSLGIDTKYFPIGFYERVADCLRGLDVDPEPSGKRPYGLTFVGGLSPELYAEGNRVLERVARELRLDVWGFGAEDLPVASELLRHHRGEAWGLDMYTLLAQSRITLNRHGEVAGGYVANMRLFEATGVGALLVTDRGKNLSELFEPGREVVAYETEEDLIDKLRHYADHDEERRRIAAAGQERTLREHTYAHRIPELAEMLEARLR